MTVGETLRHAREQHGLSLIDIAHRTNIAPHVLDSIERNAMIDVPRGVFARGYLRAYAAEVGLDGERLVREYAAETEDVDERDVIEAMRARFHTLEQNRRRVVQRVLVIAGLTCLLYLLLMDLSPPISGDANRDEQERRPQEVSLLL